MKFKNDKVASRWKDLHPKLIEIIQDADDFSKKYFDKELTIVETVTTLDEDELVGRISTTHRDKRAVDIRTKDLKEDHLKMLKLYLLNKYAKYGAISQISKRPNLIEDKPHGTGPHWHVQIQRGIKV